MNPTAELKRLGVDDLTWSTDVLTDAFEADPMVRHLFGDDAKSEQRRRYFMRCTAAYTIHFGEGYSTPDRQGVAMWLLPGGTQMTPPRMYKAGMFAAPFRMGLGGFKRFMGFADHTDKLHRSGAPMPHYYLFAMGVRTASHRKGLGSQMLDHMLERVDRERMPAYLEVQNERNLAFYRKFGFEVVEEGDFPGGSGLRNWGMLRKPQG